MLWTFTYIISVIMYVTCDIGLGRCQPCTVQFWDKQVWLNQSAGVEGCTILHCHLVENNWGGKGWLLSQKQRVLAYTPLRRVYTFDLITCPTCLTVVKQNWAQCCHVKPITIFNNIIIPTSSSCMHAIKLIFFFINKSKLKW